MRFLRGQRANAKDASFPMLQRENRGPIWKSAVDPASGRTYYFEAISRKSQWEKPEELVTARELVERRKKHAEDLQFFLAMEQNIKAKISKGSGFPLVAAAAAADTRSNNISTDNMPCSPGPDAIPFSPTSSSHSSGSDTSTNKAQEFIPSLLRVPSSSSNLSSASFASSTHPARASHVRRNTSGTVYLNEVPFSPNVDATIESICTVYRNFIIESSPETMPSGSPISVSVHDTIADLQAAVFDDRKYDRSAINSNSGLAKYRIRESYSQPSHAMNHQSTHAPVPSRAPHGNAMPSLHDIISLFRYIYDNCQMESSVLIASLVYCERLIAETKGAVRPNERNWRSILFSCLALASKVWDDCSMWNLDFACVCQKRLESFTLRRINKLEVTLLKCLNFNATVSASEYTRCYFHLQNIRSLAPSDSNVVEPLDMERAAKLGLFLSRKDDSNDPMDLEAIANRKRSRRTKSVGGRDFSSSIGNQLDMEGIQEDGALQDAGKTSSSRFRAWRSSTICLEQVIHM